MSPFRDTNPPVLSQDEWRLILGAIDSERQAMRDAQASPSMNLRRVATNTGRDLLNLRVKIHRALYGEDDE